MSLKNHPLPWKVIKDRAGDCGIYDAGGNWTGIMVAKEDEPEYDNEEIANAIVEAMRPGYQLLYQSNPVEPESYCAITVNTEDLVMRGYDVTNITKDQMSDIAREIGETLVEYGGDYWEILDEAASKNGVRTFSDTHVIATRDITERMLGEEPPYNSLYPNGEIIIPEGTEGYVIDASDDSGYWQVEWYTKGLAESSPEWQKNGDTGEVYETSGEWMTITD